MPEEEVVREHPNLMDMNLIRLQETVKDMEPGMLCPWDCKKLDAAYQLNSNTPENVLMSLSGFLTPSPHLMNHFILINISNCKFYLFLDFM